MFNKNIVVDDFTLTVGVNNKSKVLLRNTKLVIHPGNKYGLVGKNGSGKTSLLNYITQTFSKSNNIFLVEQEFIANDTVINTILKANKNKVKLENKIEHIEKILTNEKNNNLDTNFELLDKYNNLYEKLNNMNVDSDSSKIKKILVGLGFENEDFNKQVNEFSGGWRGRISLARALYMQPKILILDEPTNHLDLDAVIWLTKYLSSCYRKTLIVVSHDKNFLNDVCNNIILIERKELHYFRGNYEKFVILKGNIDAENAKKWNVAQKKITALKRKQVIGTALLERNKEIKKIEQEAKAFKPIITHSINFSFPVITSKDKAYSMMHLVNACFSFNNNKKILDNVNIELHMGDKIVIVGRNGVGKSTLFQILLGNIKLQNGNLEKSAGFRIGYFSQHSHEVLNDELTPIEYLANKASSELVKYLNEDIINSKYNKNNNEPMEFFYRKCLGEIGLENCTHKQKISTLSGGQKSRVAFAELFVTMPHLILLDEPTNHLDMMAIDALIHCINKFNGTVILITHNIELIESTNSKLYELKDGKLLETKLDNYCSDVLDRTDY